MEAPKPDEAPPLPGPPPPPPPIPVVEPEFPRDPVPDDDECPEE